MQKYCVYCVALAFLVMIGCSQQDLGELRVIRAPQPDHEYIYEELSFTFSMVIPETEGILMAGFFRITTSGDLTPDSITPISEESSAFHFSSFIVENQNQDGKKDIIILMRLASDSSLKRHRWSELFRFHMDTGDKEHLSMLLGDDSYLVMAR